MEEMYAKHGEVFTIPLLHKRMTFIIGPHAAPHFFNGTDDKMSQTEVRHGQVLRWERGSIQPGWLSSEGSCLGCWRGAWLQCLEAHSVGAANCTHGWVDQADLTPRLRRHPPPSNPQQVYNFNVPTFGKGVVYDVDQRVRSEQFRFVADALRTAKLRTYVPAFKQVGRSLRF